ncbi:MAG: PAS domain-containing protein [Anaerolineae bacterium]|nr:PAS domain-containing protein [Anaerolineae bacterium]
MAKRPASVAQLINAIYTPILLLTSEAEVTHVNAAFRLRFPYAAPLLERMRLGESTVWKWDHLDAPQRLLAIDDDGRVELKAFVALDHGEWQPVHVTACKLPDEDLTVLTVQADSVETDQLRKSHQQLIDVVENISDGFYGLDRDMCFTYVNARAEVLMQQRRDELLGKNIFELYPQIRDTPAYEALNRAAVEKEMVSFEMYSQLMQTWIEGRVYPSDSGYSVFIHDIGERKAAVEMAAQLNAELEQRVIERTAQLEATNRELEAFSYSVSHDLRAPLRAMDGFSLAILEDYGDQLDEIGQNFLKRIRSASQRMETLIDSLLQLSRLTRQPLAVQPVNLSWLTSKILAGLHDLQPERNVEFVIEEDVIVPGDENLLSALLQNLLHNSWKFTAKQAKAVITFGAKREEKRIVYYIQDNGVGFNPAHKSQLFRPFYRLHQNDEFEGLGIGLATAQRIVLRHQGEIWADADVNHGATFYFTLKVQEA